MILGSFEVKKFDKEMTLRGRVVNHGLSPRPSSRENTTKKVYVGGLENKVDWYQLKAIFSHYGSVKRVWISPKSGRFAFIEFLSTHAANEAVQKLNGTEICGSRVTVQLYNKLRYNSKVNSKRTNCPDTWKERSTSISESSVCFDDWCSMRTAISCRNQVKKEKNRQKGIHDKT